MRPLSGAVGRSRGRSWSWGEKGDFRGGKGRKKADVYPPDTFRPEETKLRPLSLESSPWEPVDPDRGARKIIAIGRYFLSAS